MMPKEFIFLPYWYGRFGNRIHEYVYLATYARINSVDFYLPCKWEGTRLFKLQPGKIIEDEKIKDFIRIFRDIVDGNAEGDFRDFFNDNYSVDIKRINPHDSGYEKKSPASLVMSHCAYSKKIYNEMSKDHILGLLEFSDEVKSLDSYKYWESRKGTYDIAHLRRGDISSVIFNKNNIQYYSVISKEAYYNAFEKYGFDKDCVEWVSDDVSKKWDNREKKCYNFGYKYPEGSRYKKGIMFDWLEDFLALYFARTIFRANSSFSWWAAFMSPTAKVYSPVLTKRHIYGVDGKEEIMEDFTEGNHPHWQKGNCDIVIN
ncbi:hypothetical protein CMI47_02005 [Candidatus Pacearchaeota archaeon]|nr:hypothetical protein [Candidatus Pacearchaeota archaeon]|tara:strand:+ start:3695 stop:4642 length:948 start_codon:yes stop_codon:yes gene_type:complete